MARENVKNVAAESVQSETDMVKALEAKFMAMIQNLQTENESLKTKLSASEAAFTPNFEIEESATNPGEPVVACKVQAGKGARSRTSPKVFRFLVANAEAIEKALASWVAPKRG